jgi:hypothetical protein
MCVRARVHINNAPMVVALNGFFVLLVCCPCTHLYIQQSAFRSDGDSSPISAQRVKNIFGIKGKAELLKEISCQFKVDIFQTTLIHLALIRSS